MDKIAWAYCICVVANFLDNCLDEVQDQDSILETETKTKTSMLHSHRQDVSELSVYYNVHYNGSK